MTPLAAAATAGSPAANVAVFGAVVALFLVCRARRNARAGAGRDAVGRSFSSPQSGVGIAGDSVSGASFLGIVGLVALYGYDGFLYSIGFLVAWLVALVLVAELLRNAGNATMADVLSLRLRQRPVRAAAAAGTLAVSLLYLIAQMAGVGGLVALLLGVSATAGISVAIAVVGLMMTACVLAGGRKGAASVQIVQVLLLMAGAVVMTVWVLARTGFDLSQLFGDAMAASGNPELIEPMQHHGASGLSKLDVVSLSMALVLGIAGLPHVLMHLSSQQTSTRSRRSVVWAIGLIGVFCLCTLVLGFGAAALVGRDAILATAGASNSAAPLLAVELGGALLLGFLSAVVFMTILAVIAGLTSTAAAAFAHDIYANVVKRPGEVDSDGEVRIARIAVVVIGVLAIVGGIAAQRHNVALLIALAFAVAASANLPTIVYSLYWQRFNTTGALASMYGGLILAVGLIAISPTVSGSETSMIPNADFAIFPLSNPGIVSIPAEFLLGIIGTYLGKPSPEHGTQQAEMEVRALTGAGAEKAVAP